MGRREKNLLFCHVLYMIYTKKKKGKTPEKWKNTKMESNIKEKGKIATT